MTKNKHSIQTKYILSVWRVRSHESALTVSFSFKFFWLMFMLMGRLLHVKKVMSSNRFFENTFLQTQTQAQTTRHITLPPTSDSSTYMYICYLHNHLETGSFKTGATRNTFQSKLTGSLHAQLFDSMDYSGEIVCA